MKRPLFLLFCFLPFLLAIGYATKVYAWKLWQTPTDASVFDGQATPSEPAETGHIQVALLLDVSGSMDGLIDQAQAQLWDMVHQLSEARRAGASPKVELALYIYGGDFIPAEQGHVQQLLPFTQDLDAVSEQLFAQTTDGGSEYAGWVIQDAVQDLAWSENEQDLRMIFIAGNESFAQGPVLYQQACQQAQARGILINTIFCGDYRNGLDLQWQMGATAGGGQFLHIDHNQDIEHLATPYDTTILRLNQRLNDTYVSYGQQGQALKQRQLAQDQAMAEKYGSSGLSKRALAKSKGKVYCNDHWDLVDACVKPGFEWGKVDPQTLTPELRNLSPEELKATVMAKAEARKRVQTEIASIEQARKAYVTQQRQQASDSGAKTLDRVVKQTIRKQAEAKKFSFEKP